MKILVITTFTLFFFLIISCKPQTKQSEKIEKEEKEIDEQFFEREKELFNLLKELKVSVNQNTVVLTPPTKCSSCKINTFKTIDTLKNAVILVNKGDQFLKELSASQKLIYYDEETLKNKGLIKLYPIIFYIENKKIKKFIPLVN